MENVGEKIRGRRKMMAFSQLKLAENITSQSAISRLENDIFTIPLNELMDVLERLNLSMHDVFCGNEKTLGNIVREELDEARGELDYERMEQILKSYNKKFWNQSPEMAGYESWHRGLVKQANGEYRDALRLISKAIEKNQINEKMYEMIAEMHLAKGNIYNMNNLSGLDSYKEALYYYELSKKSSHKLVVKILYNLTVSFCEAEEHGKSLRYSNKALEILHKNESTYLICYIMYMKMSAMIHLGKQEEYVLFRNNNRIFFEIYNKLQLLVNLENYSRENIS
ncbi:helix-turn-helix transcriptional regulator [Salinicoccus cyprini]|uniref:Helix-turn-helix transcriptional regulator n=1 Tax=Salinicoccus cyprini TaxID=2493691 RepID=A0A558AUS2_9STAP|nr:helix-turn-helix transcriptional regulator [Salinicoccus cyprini]TVT28022.1 helix-turn-helix transcriptional regulator [Salinicoccus cyprini]